MEEIRKFFRLLRKYRLALIIIPLVAIVVTYFLVQNLPNTYTSQARISTGLVNQNQSSSIINSQRLQGQELQQQFASLVETAQMKTILDQVTLRLLIHDFSETPFSVTESYINALSPQERSKDLAIYRSVYKEHRGLNEWDKSLGNTIDMSKKLKYDAASLRKNIKLYRAGDSDFIVIDVEAEDSKLSAFIANAISEEFIAFHDRMISSGDTSASNLLQRLIDEKHRGLNRAVDSLKRYKIRNRVLNLNEQARQLYGQILNYEDKKLEIEKDIASATGALSEIDKKFLPSERKYIESTLLKLNTAISSSKDKLQRLYDQYIQKNLDVNIKRQIDSLESTLEEQISQTSDSYLFDPLTTKGNLIQEKLKLSIQLDIARFSHASVNAELIRLNRNFDSMVPHEAFVQSLERDVDVASSEYLDMLNKYNQLSLQSEFHIHLELAQLAQPGVPQPNKKMLLVLISGVVSIFFCLIVIFVIFYFDDSVSSDTELAKLSGLPVLGTMNRVHGTAMDLRSLWLNSVPGSAESIFKEQLRSLRFELDDSRVGNLVAISAVQADAGKTFITLSLAYALSTTSRRILVIDGNFKSPQLSQLNSSSKIFVEDYLKGNVDINTISSVPNEITIFANRGADISVFEIERKEVIIQRLRELASVFDMVIVDTANFNSATQAREWISLCDCFVAVFESGKVLSDSGNSTISYLRSLGPRFSGWVINKA